MTEDEYGIEFDLKLTKFNDSIKQIQTNMDKLSKVVEQNAVRLGKLYAIAGLTVANFAKDMTKKLIGSTDKGVKSLKRFAFSLFGVQTAWRSVSKAVHAYLSYDSELQKSLQQTWAGLGSFFAPILEYVVGLFKELLTYINAVVKAFTGIDFVARANAKSLEKMAKAQKQLSGLDEIKNLTEQNDNQIQLGDIDETPIEEMVDKIKEKINTGDWFGLGKLFGTKITEALEGIKWNSIQEKAGQIGKGIAEFINGGIESHIISTTGTTIAQALNTVLSLTTNFIKTLDWQQTGKEIAESINNMFRTIKWEDVAYTLGNGFVGLVNLSTEAIEKLDTKAIADAIKKFLANIPWLEIGKSIFNLLVAGIKLVVRLTVDLFFEEFEEKLNTGLKTGFKNPKTLLQNITDSGKSFFKGANMIKKIFTPTTWATEGAKWIGNILGQELGNEFTETGEVSGVNLGSSIINSTANSITTNTNKVESASYKTGNIIANNIESGFNDNGNTNKKMSNLGAGIGSSILSGITANLNTNQISNSLKNTVNNLNIESDMKNIGSVVGTSLNIGLNNGLGNFASNIASSIKPGLNEAIKKLNEFLTLIQGNFSLGFTGAGALGSAIGGINAVIKKIPYLSIGTDEVKSEGFAYLHAGEKVVPADVSKGGYTVDNDETNSLLRELIEAVQRKDFNAYISQNDIGRASVNYIRNQNRIMGGSVI